MIELKEGDFFEGQIEFSTNGNASLLVENKEISCSRNYSDLVALFYLGNSQSYLEIGAGEPIIGSDTFLLEQEMQWTGIQVEPDVQTFNKLQIARPNSIQINAAMVGDADKSEYFLKKELATRIKGNSRHGNGGTKQP